LLITRSTKEQDMGEQIVSQLLSKPKSLAITSAILGGMGLIPGMPNLPFLLPAVAGGTSACYIAQRQKASATAEVTAQPARAETPRERREWPWDDLSPVDPIGREVGYRLIALVDKTQGGQLMGRIKGIRKKISQALGFLLPPVHIRDNLDLAPT